MVAPVLFAHQMVVRLFPTEKLHSTPKLPSILDTYTHTHTHTHTHTLFLYIYFYFILFFSFFAFSRATLVAHGGSQTRGRIGAVAIGLRQSHSNARSKPMSATYTTAHGNADPQATERGQ